MAISYRYDSMNRLTNEDRNGTGERYAYDLCGNRLIKEQYRGGCVDVTEGYRYNERNELTERVRAGSLIRYRYDKNGSIISEEEEGRKSEYRYDLLNRQTYVKTLEGKEQENFYDGEGLRAGVTENGKRTTFLYYNGEILTESDGDSVPVRRYVRGNSLSCVQTSHDNACHFYYQDEQGSTAYITGQENAVENSYQYDAFGNLLERREDITNRVLYTGQQYDQETGQYYLRARYYNPVVGRFLQEDTYRGDGLNLYAYCANNPVMYYDPSGHSFFSKLKEWCKKMAEAFMEDTPAGEVIDEGGSGSKGLIDGAPEPEVQNFIERFKERYPRREYKSGHKRQHSDGRNNIEIDFETDNAILEFKRGNGKGLTRQIIDRQDPMVNPNGKVVIGVPGSKMSRFAQQDVENAGGLMSNDIDLILELIKPD